MKKLCLFSSYFNEEDIPIYIKIYLIELKKYFQEIIFISVNDKLSDASKHFLVTENIDLKIVSNEGYDFGQYYKVLCNLDSSQYEQIALVNDSCLLFAPLNGFIEWSNSNSADMQGMTVSYVNGKHLQSFFLVIKKTIISTVVDYFNTHKIINNFIDVINIYEIGLSKHLILNGYTIDSYIKNDSIHKEFSPYYYNIKQHIKDGIPIIKQKILSNTYRKDELKTLARMNFVIEPNYYVQLIKQYNKTVIFNFNEDISNKPVLNQRDILIYNLKKAFYNHFRILKKVSWLFTRVYNKISNIINTSINKLFIYFEVKNLIKPIIYGVFKENENAVKIQHNYPINYNTNDVELFKHANNYQSYNETVFNFTKVNVSDKGVLFKGYRNSWTCFPHKIFRYDYGFLYLLKLRLFKKKVVLDKSFNYIVLFDFWSKSNYYHWLIDSLPRLLSIEQELAKADFSLLLPENGPKYILDSLSYFNINHITFIKSNTYVSAENLILPYYLAGSGHIRPDKVLKLKHFFLDKISSKTSIKRIYASRATQNNRKISNEKEVVNLLIQKGFEIVYFENYTFEEQVSLVKNADFLVSSHGANMTNLMFMQSNTSVLELIKEINPNFCYWGLASSVNVNYYYQLCAEVNHDDLEVDLNKLQTNLKRMLNE